MPDTSYNYGVKPGQGSNREDLRGGRMARRKPSVIAGARPSMLDVGMAQAAAEGSGIQAGTRPVKEPTPLDSAVAAAKKIWAQLHGTPKKSAPKAEPPYMSRAEEERLSRKYLDRK